MVSYISSMPLLLFSLIVWLVTLFIFIFYKEERNSKDEILFDDVIKRLAIFGISFFFLIASMSFSLVDVTCVNCDCTTTEIYNESGQSYYNSTSCDTQLGNHAIYPISKIGIPLLVMLTLQGIILIIYLYSRVFLVLSQRR